MSRFHARDPRPVHGTAWRPGPRCQAAGLLMAVLALLALPSRASAERLAGTVERVVDGDSIWVRRSDAEPPLKVRLAGIDAPERCQAGGPRSKRALTDRLLHRRVVLDRSGLDKYERSLARVWLDGEDIGAWMVAQGHAWSFSRASSLQRPGGRYAAEQRGAVARRAGLFAEEAPMPPWWFRSMHGPCASETEPGG